MSASASLYDQSAYLVMKSLLVPGVIFTFVATSIVKCSGEGSTSHPNPAIGESSSSHGWIDNVLVDSSPSVSQNSPLTFANERHEGRLAPTRVTSPSSSGWVESVLRDSPASHDFLHNSIHSPSVATAVPSAHQGEKGAPRGSSATLPYPHGTVIKKYNPREGDFRTKEASWRIHDHERSVKHSNRSVMGKGINEDSPKMHKYLDEKRIRFHLDNLKEDHPVRYVRELHNASIWKYNKNAAIHKRKAIRMFHQMQPKPTFKQMEDAHLEHRLHLCNLRREKYKRRQARKKNARDEHPHRDHE
ncbi:uncharacterized protein FA14DRAFT_79479 [Meira miltonrushii]|uniref:Uncharacterized protein n=1 Tax=Meira miltonrushii TaxID=1280837 RepID=A0A316V6X0_9BASI|nr:uncharacterized protein FA14DRAFT_79479 [Meira miltonrushii]PWN32934.1 hypothetical protein FA14DRAFT_79479 [Meira miltonrushii]